jgi:methyltransferase
VRPARYPAVLVLFCVQRLIELAYSARNERRIRERDPEAAQAGRSSFKWIVLTNVGLFTLPAVEAIVRRRQPPRWMAVTGWAAALAAVALRLSVLSALRGAWTVRAMVPHDLEVVDRGPYRFIRHPNYVALGLEFAGLPLIGGATWSAVGLGVANAVLLAERIRHEDALLLAIPAYRERMAAKPRFVPRIRALSAR